MAHRRDWSTSTHHARRTESCSASSTSACSWSSDTMSDAGWLRRRRSAGIVLRATQRWRHRGAARSHGRPVLGPQGRGAWTIPKGEIEAGEDPLTVARREFEEELGVPVPAGELVDLGEIRQSGGKVVRAWARRGRSRPGDRGEQHLRTRVAAAVRTDPGVPRDRPSRMVRRADGADQGRDRPT